ncbi:MAG: M28 family peptidase [Armatimonadetes bacterium]|nr:M28 family peptidase [Armatimonadota bacterium]
MLDWASGIRMPGRSFRGPLPAAGPETRRLREELRRDVLRLSRDIGERHLGRPRALEAAAALVEAALTEAGWSVRRQSYQVDGRLCHNLEGELRGGHEIIVVGAHYDSIPGCPAANDNASGVAALLALARELGRRRYPRTLRLLAFVNEEPPYFQTASMGSRVYARECRQKQERVVGMICLETIGFYSDRKGSQQYPLLPLKLLYPSTGDFVAFVANAASTAWLREVIGRFRELAAFPSVGAALPAAIPGVDWSDHWSFWQEGYPALMITDTAPFRYPHYHTAEDTADKLDYDRMARVVQGIERVLDAVAASEGVPA